ncbi:hypothetical protein ACG04R_13400 [Roseateles sp. BYS78W]|uniref:Cardiolipin synthase N-terminal domain-containing protein n=1 Tax=Pelomonas candidula TaxID=3299025 RepID=A0ABW7HDW8_9BURK
MGDVGFILTVLGILALYVTLALLAIGHVLRNNQPRLWFVVFFCMPLGGPLLYALWPKGTKSKPAPRSGWLG